LDKDTYVGLIDGGLKQPIIVPWLF